MNYAGDIFLFDIFLLLFNYNLYVDLLCNYDFCVPLLSNAQTIALFHVIESGGVIAPACVCVCVYTHTHV